MSPAAIDEIRDVVLRHGGDDLTVDHPTTTLEELFLRIVEESKARPGRRYLPPAAAVATGGAVTRDWPAPGRSDTAGKS